MIPAVGAGARPLAVAGRIEHPGVEPGTHSPGQGSGLLDRVGQDGRAGQAVAARRHASTHRCDAGEVRRLGRVAETGGQLAAAGQHQAGALRVLVPAVRDAAAQGPLVAAVGQQRQVLADLEPGSASGNRSELAPNVLGGIRLGIKALVLSQPAGQEDVDDRTGTTERTRLGAKPFDVGHRQAHQSQCACLEDLATRPAGVVECGRAGWGHGGSLERRCVAGDRFRRVILARYIPVSQL